MIEYVIAFTVFGWGVVVFVLIAEKLQVSK